MSRSRSQGGQAQQEMAEITCRVISIPVSKPSQYNEGKVWCVINTNLGKLTGEVDSGSIITGCDYRASGTWEENQYGKSFKFRAIVIREPSTRNGVVQYLSKFCPYIGQVTANRLCDKYGVDAAIGKLRESPDEVAADGLLNQERASRASEELKKMAAFEDTRVKLLDIFTGRPFRKILPDLLIEKYGSKAADVVRSNAFVLLDNRFPGCGFQLVDQLYLALGGDSGDMVRQVYALRYVLENLPDGSSWGRRSDVYSAIGKICGQGLQFTECINEAVRQNKVKVRIEKPSNEMWIACKEYADQESMIAERLWEIGGTGLLGGSDEEFDDADEVEPDENSQESEASGNTVSDTIGDTVGDDVVDDLLAEYVSDDVRDINPSVPKSHQVMDQNDSLCFDLDASIEPDDLYHEAKELVDELDEALEDLASRAQDTAMDEGSSDAALDYSESCTISLAGISEYIERRKTATDKQIRALRNMLAGANAWLERI